MNHSGRRIGFEFKCSDAPVMTRSLRIALDDLELSHAFVVYPGEREYRLEERVDVLPLGRVARL